VPGPFHADGYVERLSSPWWAYPVVIAIAIMVAL